LSQINKEAADVDGSCQVDSLDFALMRMRLIGKIDKFPVEG
jgi:mannan endo-1,4-beta-mannosidase